MLTFVLNLSFDIKLFYSRNITFLSNLTDLGQDISTTTQKTTEPPATPLHCGS